MLAPGHFERRVGATGTAAILALLLFFGALAYWQVFRTDLSNDDGNPRVLATFNDPNRGRILDREGNEIVGSTADGTRYYNDVTYAHLVGYLDARYGSQGAELAFNDSLSGKGAPSWQGAFDAEFRREALKGNDIRLTIDPVIQAAAAAALADRRGAVVALNPQNGELLAMVSVPTYDPGSLETDGEALLAAENAPLLNRATQGLYPPGSTFKSVTAIAALENGVIKPDTRVTCPGQIVFDGFPVSCSNVPQGPGTYPFKNAFTFSVNAIFAQVGVNTGWERLMETATRLGFGRALEFTLDTAPSQVHGPDTEETTTLLASTAFGQGELLATPLQMAVVAAAIANGGVVVTPHIGLAEMDGEEVVRKLGDGSSRRVMSEEVSRTMRDFMVSVVDNQQADGVAMQGIKIGGKTGTAEAGDGTSHAWFIAFAPAENPTIAVAVLVENGGRGGVVASPVAGAVIRAALGR